MNENKTIYFMRHGDVLPTQTKDYFVPVEKRVLGLFPRTNYEKVSLKLPKRLSEETQSKLELAAKDIATKADGRFVKIWTSPVERARFTAYELAKKLGEKHDCLTVNSYADLSVETYCIDHFVRGCILQNSRSPTMNVVISHQPDLYRYLGKSLNMCEYVCKEFPAQTPGDIR